MTANDLAFLSLNEQAELIHRGELSPVTLVEAYLGRIERHDDSLKAFITIEAEAALAAAKAAEDEIQAGNYRSALHGIPFAVKDQILIKGVRVTGGSKVLSDHIGQRDATLIARLKKAGAILLGTLNTHEFHMGPTRDFPFGTPRNPWNLDRATGGSSSGSAAAVAAGLCTFSLGGDTSGSIRGPAAYCGTVGLKATWSRVSRDGVFPLAWTLDCVGPLTRTSQDAALVLQVLAGHDPLDPTSSSVPVADYADGLTNNLEGIRGGVVKELMNEPETNVGVRVIVDDAIEVLRDLGAEIRKVQLPQMADSKYVTSPLVLPDAVQYHRPLLLENYEDYDVNTRVRLMIGAALPAGIIGQADRARIGFTRAALKAFEDVDVFVGAAAGEGAPPLTYSKRVTTKEEAVYGTFGAGAVAGHHSRLASLAGLPALSVPCGFDSNGMPLGLHVGGKYFDEATVLKVAHAYEIASGGLQKRPPLV